MLFKVACYNYVELSLTQDFTGNADSNTIKRHNILVPAIATSLLLIPTSWHNNIGLRIEIYGCKPGKERSNIYLSLLVQRYVNLQFV